MRFLLDTHVIIWAAKDDPKLPSRVRGTVFASGNEVMFSSASAYEIALKTQIDPLSAKVDALMSDYEAVLVGAGWSPLPLLSMHMAMAGGFPLTHRDPFDRMLAAQAICEDLTLVSKDAAVDQFGVRRAW